jgi:predicted DNA-binding protein with PD1-like motif
MEAGGKGAGKHSSKGTGLPFPRTTDELTDGLSGDITMDRPLLVRLPMGEDLLDAITSEFQKRSIRKAAFFVIGAVNGAVLSFYNPVTRRYQNREFEGSFEIVSCSGNVSEKDGEIFAHVHAVFAGEHHACFGGHLMRGSRIFAAELHVVPVSGSIPVRTFDEPTGLYLWPMEGEPTGS